MAERGKKSPLSVTVELRRLMHSVPFSPFQIRTTDGDTFTVSHPDFIMISPSEDMAVLYPREEQGHHVVNLRQVVSMRPAGNGSRKSPRR